MSKATIEQKKTRTHYSQQYKDEALVLAELVGITKAAAQLGLKEALLYAWRTKTRQSMNTGAREQQLADENVRLKRQLAEQGEELALVKKSGSVLCQTPEVKSAFIAEHIG